jgi:hypothetical protein
MISNLLDRNIDHAQDRTSDSRCSSQYLHLSIMAQINDKQALTSATGGSCQAARVTTACSAKVTTIAYREEINLSSGSPTGT